VGKRDLANTLRWRSISLPFVLNDLPKFSGNPKKGEIQFKVGLNVKTFFRSLDNYFTSHDVTADGKKLEIMYALIDTTKGDAVDLMACYSGKKVTFKEVETEFLAMYPNFTATEFRHAARTILESKVTEPSIFSGMTKLETQSLAVIEAYVNTSAMEEAGIKVDTHVGPTPEGTNPILVVELLQNFMMHLMMATQLPKKTYDNVAKVTPVITSTKFMSLAVKASEKYKLLDGETDRAKTRINQNEVIYKIQTQPPNTSANKPYENTGNTGQRPYGNTGNTGQRPYGNTGNTGHRPYGNTGNSVNRPYVKYGNTDHKTYGNNAGKPQGNTRGCFRCGKPNHFAKEYREATYCTLCRIKGHTKEVCRKNNVKSVNIYCSNCNRYNSHTTNECYSTGRKDFRSQGQGVRVMEEKGFENPEIQYESEDQDDPEHSEE
jgi:hypothetical protein